MCYQKGCGLFEGFFGFEPIEDDECSFLTLVHIEGIRQDDHHEWDNEGTPYY